MDETVVLSESKEILFSAQLFRASQIDMSSSKVEWYFLNTTSSSSISEYIRENA